MAKPQEVKLSKKDQKSVMVAFRKTKDAKKIAETLKLPRHQVMFFFEEQGIRQYSEGSYQ